tara:strand:+ start:574 stop:1080 length:507 start_codon:yes stop_codon:yes gene_type:complete
MNIVITGIIIFIITFLLLSLFARAKTKKIAKGIRSLIVILSLLVAIFFAIGNKILLSLPLFFLAISALKIKGLGALQIILLFRLLNQLRSTGRYSFNQNNHARPTSDLSIDEAYKILGVKKGCTKEDVIKAANSLQKKIHPDVGNPNSEYLSKLVNSSKDLILKTDFS